MTAMTTKSTTTTITTTKCKATKGKAKTSTEATTSTTLNKNADTIEERLKKAQATLSSHSKLYEPTNWGDAHGGLALLFAEQVYTTTNVNLHYAADKALKHLGRMYEVVSETQEPARFARMKSCEGRMYQKRVAGSRADNLMTSLHCLQTALQLFEQLDEKTLISEQHSLIADVYTNSNFVGNVRAENLNFSIRHLLAATQFVSKSDDPNFWAKVHYRLAVEFRQRTSGSMGSNYNVAVKQFTKSLEVYTKTGHRLDWALVHAYLAVLYRDWPIPTDNITPAQIAYVQTGKVEKCIVHCERALEVYSVTCNSSNWLMLKDAVIGAYTKRTVGDHEDKKAKLAKHNDELLCGKNTLGVDKTLSPDKRGRWHAGIAKQFEDRVVGNRTKNIQKALKQYALALENYSPTFMPEQWRKMHSNIGTIYLFNKNLAGPVEDNEATGLGHMHNALEMLTEESFPDEWYRMHYNLGQFYRSYKQGNKQDRMTMAAEHYAKLVEGSTAKQIVPTLWGSALHSLGVTYAEGVNGISEEEGKEKAIDCYARYITDTGHDEESAEWLCAHSNLSILFGHRKLGDRASNMDKSLEHYTAFKAGVSLEDLMPDLVTFSKRYDELHGGDECFGAAALAKIVDKLRTPLQDDDPVAWASNRVVLADMCLKHTDMEKRSEKVEKAIGYLKSAMTIFANGFHHNELADATMHMCAAYLQRVVGERRDNLENAVRFFLACKKIRPDEALPDVKKLWGKGATARKYVPKQLSTETQLVCK